MRLVYRTISGVIFLQDVVFLQLQMITTSYRGNKPYSPHPSPAHSPLAAPNNTYTTHLSSSRCNTYITTPTPNTPDLTHIWIRYQLNTTAYTYTHEIPIIFTTHYSTQRHYGSHILRFFPLLSQCRTPYVVVRSLVLLKMGLMVPETC